MREKGGEKIKEGKRKERGRAMGFGG